MALERFNDLARAFGASMSRRTGLRAAAAAVAAAVIGLPAASLAEARGEDKPRHSRHGHPAPDGGPCGDGSGKDNACKKHGDCCTGFCNRRKKRCRCKQRGKRCSQDRNCCGSLSCVKRKCAPPPPDPRTVQTGMRCRPVDTCADPQAACTTYQSGSPDGTYCLLPKRSDCTAASQCETSMCEGGICLGCSCAGCAGACVPTVCASGCAHATVQAALTAASAGATIAIAPGTYSEDLAVSKSVALRGCPGGDVILKNASLGARAISVSAGANVDLIDVIVDGYNVNPTSGGGGIAAAGDVSLCGNAVIRNAFHLENGAGVNLVSASPATLTLTMSDQSAIHDCESTVLGGGAYIDSYNGMVMNDAAEVRDCTAMLGGGVRIVALGGTSGLTMNDAAAIIGNQTSLLSGGGVDATAGASVPVIVQMSGTTRIANNSAKGAGGGVNVSSGGQDGNGAVLLSDEATISGNHSDTYGGGVRVEGVPLMLDDDAAISTNTASFAAGVAAQITGQPAAGYIGVSLAGNSAVSNNTASTGVGGGLWLSGVAMTMEGTSTVSGNTTPTLGGGISMAGIGSDYASLAITGSATITGNSAGGGAGSGGGVAASNVAVTVTGSAAITGNTPDDCVGATGC